MIGNVVFWGFTKPSGVHILEAITEEFKNHGATHINCASHFPENSSGRLYERFGLHPAETQYVGKIDALKTLA
jgi:hypothetical protein